VFYLRILLHHVPGATSFTDIRTVNGIVCNTNQEACRQRGLLLDDNEWEGVMQAAAETEMPPQLRQLFVALLLFCEPADPAALFERHHRALGEDFQHRHPEQPSLAWRFLALLDVEKRLQRAGKELHDFQLPPVSDEDRELAIELEVALRRHHLPHVIQEELNFDAVALQQQATAQQATLLPDQRAMVDAVISAIHLHQPLAVFVDAPGGTGKTYTLNTLLAKVRSEGGIALAVAYSGIAATLLENGRTFHSRFKAPLKCTDTSTCNILAQSPLAQLIREARLIVWDEAPMAHRHLLEALDRTLRDIMESPVPFGGKVLVLSGDFRQILPVVRRATRAQIVASCLKRSPLWEHFVTYRFTENMRARLAVEDQTDVRDFTEWLMQLGDGRLATDDDGAVQLPEDCVMLNDMGAVVQWVFDELAQKYNDPLWMSSRAVLAPKNTVVDRINDFVCALFPGQATTLLSADSMDDDSGEGVLQIPQEYLNTLCVSGFPPHALKLKPGMPIMLLRNLSPSDGLCNGTRLVVRRLVTDRLLEASIASGTFAGKLVLIPRLTLRPPDDAFPFLWQRRQFPVRVAFGMTINKAQGQTLQRVAVFLEEPVFGHGQLYVAASRVGCAANLKFALPRSARGRTQNVVYTELMQ
jgi:ATP-dependent DNA helicase PIF1